MQRHELAGFFFQMYKTKNQEIVKKFWKYIAIATVTAAMYNPQNHLAADNKTTCFIFPLKQKTKRLKKRSKQHTKSVIQMLFKSH